MSSKCDAGSGQRAAAAVSVRASRVNERVEGCSIHLLGHSSKRDGAPSDRSRRGNFRWREPCSPKEEAPTEEKEETEGEAPRAQHRAREARKGVRKPEESEGEMERPPSPPS